MCTVTICFNRLKHDFRQTNVLTKSTKSVFLHVKIE